MRKFFVRLFLSYIVVFILPLVITVLVSYFYISDGIKKSADTGCRKEIARLLDTYEEEFEAIDKIAIELSFSQWVKKMYNSRISYEVDEAPWDVYETDENIDTIARYVVLNNYFFDLGVVFPRQDCVISSNGMTTFKQFFNNNFRFGDLDDRDWEDLMQPLPSSLFLSPRTLDYKNYNYYGLKIDTAAYLSGIPALDSTIKAYVVAYIKTDKLADSLESFSYIDNALLYILDESGRQLGNVKGKGGKDMDVEAVNGLLLSGLDRGLVEKPETDKSEEVLIKGDKYILYCSYLPRTSLRLVTIIPQKTAMAEMTQMTNVTVIAVVACSILGFVLSYLIAVKNYYPIIKIFKLFSSRYSEKNIPLQRFDYNLLHKSVNSLISEEDLLRKRVNSFMPIIQNAYLSNILTGSIPYDESLTDKLASMGVLFKFALFVTVLLHFSTEMGIGNNKKEKICTELEAGGAKAYFTELDGNRKCLVINFEDAGSLEKHVNLLKNLISAYVCPEFIITVSDVFGFPEGMNNSYGQVVRAMDYRLAYDSSETIYYSRINKRKGMLYYPISTEQYIINAIKACKKECIDDIIRQIIATNVESDSYSPDIAKCLYYNLIGSALKLINEFELSKEVSIDILDFNRHENINAMENYILPLFSRIYSAVNSRKTASDDYLINYILQWIGDHYSDPNLSLNLIAAQVKKSVPYISSFFKEKTGCNFSDFVNGIRIGKAKELLNGDLTIRRIAELTGYTNDIHFRRVFKKHEGITPGVYVVLNKI